MVRFFEILQSYLNPEEEFVKKWSVLKQLLILIGGKKLTSEQQHIAVFLILQAESHIISSCYSKVYDLANELRNEIEELCNNIIKFLPNEISNALEIEIKKHRISKDEYSNLINESKSIIVMKRDWNFYVLKNNEKTVLCAFNLVSPVDVLAKELESYEENILSKGEYFPICSDIADKLRFDYWIKGNGKLHLTNQSSGTKNSWLASLRSLF